MPVLLCLPICKVGSSKWDSVWSKHALTNAMRSCCVIVENEDHRICIKTPHGCRVHHDELSELSHGLNTNFSRTRLHDRPAQVGDPRESVGGPDTFEPPQARSV
jgi:hypothetical protein